MAHGAFFQLNQTSSVGVGRIARSAQTRKVHRCFIGQGSSKAHQNPTGPDQTGWATRVETFNPSVKLATVGWAKRIQNINSFGNLGIFLGSAFSERQDSVTILQPALLALRFSYYRLKPIPIIRIAATPKANDTHALLNLRLSPPRAHELIPQRQAPSRRMACHALSYEPAPKRPDAEAELGPIMIRQQVLNQTRPAALETRDGEVVIFLQPLRQELLLQTHVLLIFPCELLQVQLLCGPHRFLPRALSRLMMSRIHILTS